MRAMHDPGAHAARMHDARNSCAWPCAPSVGCRALLTHALVAAKGIGVAEAEGIAMPTATPTGTATGIPVAGSAPAPALAVPLGGLLSLSASSTSKSIFSTVVKPRTDSRKNANHSPTIDGVLTPKWSPPLSLATLSDVGACFAASRRLLHGPGDRAGEVLVPNVFNSV
jgi:hypothetical protein